jgi:hypothetical protein
MRGLAIIFFCLFHSIGHTLSGQVPNIRFEHLTNDEGLSNVNVNVLLQDSKQFIWDRD